jgi:hypothetical protein
MARVNPVDLCWQLSGYHGEKSISLLFFFFIRLAPFKSIAAIAGRAIARKMQHALLHPRNSDDGVPGSEGATTILRRRFP